MSSKYGTHRLVIILLTLFLTCHLFANNVGPTPPSSCPNLTEIVERLELSEIDAVCGLVPCRIEKPIHHDLGAQAVLRPRPPAPFNLFEFHKRAREDSNFLNTREGQEGLLRLMRTDDPAQMDARKALLEKGVVRSFGHGGMGFTIAIEDDHGHVSRYKGPLTDNSLVASGEAKENLKLFEKEVALAVKIGKVGIGPKSKFDVATGLLKMEEIRGMNLHDFKTKILDEIPRGEREEWISNFILALSKRLKQLHAIGIADLDLKPGNIMIPRANKMGKNIFLIDFGLALRLKEVSAKRRELDGKPYRGTYEYMGKNAFSGNPGIPDDFEAMRIVVEKLLPEGNEKNAPLHERPFAESRPELRALFSLLGQPMKSEADSDSKARIDHGLLAMAVRKDLSPSERNRFWDTYLQRFNERSPGQQLKILFSDPQLYSRDGFLSRFTREQLKTIVADGMKENSWLFNSEKHEIVLEKKGDVMSFLFKRREHVNFRKLADFLGDVPDETKADKVAHPNQTLSPNRDRPNIVLRDEAAIDEEPDEVARALLIQLWGALSGEAGLQHATDPGSVLLKPRDKSEPLVATPRQSADVRRAALRWLVNVPIGMGKRDFADELAQLDIKNDSQTLEALYEKYSALFAHLGLRKEQAIDKMLELKGLK